MKKIKNALVSVYYKDNLEAIVEKLEELNITIYSTGGTQKFIEEQGVKVEAVENLTSYPSILGGRVKTLHPKIFGGILSRRDNEGDVKQLEEFEIPEIDLVIVDLYPFSETVAAGGDGGISLIRAAAKNFNDVVIVPSRNEYPELLELLNSHNGETSIEQRKAFAEKAFKLSSSYDSAIYEYFNDGRDNSFKQDVRGSRSLRYGENPHQEGRFHGELDQMFEQHNGKELSYNNLLDVDAAVNLILEFTDTTFVILKHNNACGVASRDTLLEAYNAALEGDPVSAFGGVLITNQNITVDVAEEINKLFCEVLIAPGYEDGTLEILKSKKNRILLTQKQGSPVRKQFRSVLNGVLQQDQDVEMTAAADFKKGTENGPTDQEVLDLEFANKLAKHTKSNTIVIAKGLQL